MDLIVNSPYVVRDNNVHRTYCNRNLQDFCDKTANPIASMDCANKNLAVIHLGRTLKALRDEKGLSTRELEKKAGVNKSQISEAEKYPRIAVQERTFIKILKALDCSRDRFYRLAACEWDGRGTSGLRIMIFEKLLALGPDSLTAINAQAIELTKSEVSQQAVKTKPDLKIGKAVAEAGLAVRQPVAQPK